MYSNYPNPFNAETVIPFTLDRAGKVRINIYDITGRSAGVLRATPLHNWYPSGTHEFVWNAEGMASGVYLVRLTFDGGQLTVEGEQQKAVRKVLLVK